MILFNNEVVQFHHFPNGETYFDNNFFSKRYSTLNVVTLKYETDDDLFRLLLIKEAMSFPCTLRVTYFPYSRMDREEFYPFTLKFVAKFINSMGWEKVIIYEPHSDVLPALLDRVKVVEITASALMKSKINIELGLDHQICYPDVGAFKRYSESFKTSDPLVGFKRREFETGKIVSLNISGVRTTSNVAIVDDLCSKGGTFVLAAEKLKAMGFEKIMLVVAHCENTIFDGKVFSSGLIDSVLTTDSIKHNISPIFPYSSSFREIPLSQFSWG